MNHGLQILGDGPPDPVDRMLVDQLTGLPSLPGSVVVLDDATGDLAPAVAKAVRGQVRVHCDDLAAEEVLAGAGFTPSALSADLFDGAGLVLMRLPRALAALREYAELTAAHAAPSVRLIGAARIKHMSRSMNEVLGESFEHVWAGLGRQKCRALHASGPRPVDPQWPRAGMVEVPGGPLELRSHGAAFAAGRLDDGTRLLLQALADAHPGSSLTGRQALDLGCGTGILATWLARAGADVQAVDSSAAAQRSAIATAAANEVDVEVRRSTDLSFLDDASLDLVVCNPPFHKGAAKDSTAAFEMIHGAARILRPGGELWLVYNSHLPYLRALRRHVGETRIVQRNRHYTVTRTTR
ncbi:class I SAM-dependent methyltransferase [Enemella sp. A6]|uniref:class I SAM-dependent methyltransferase n=1 Tax=Enemella sp. A6 TaxID=3440152 RepID=UPI003EBA5701